MNADINDKSYTSMKLPKPIPRSVPISAPDSSAPTTNKTAPIPTEKEDIYYEIDYDAYPVRGAGKFVRKALKLDTSQEEHDEIRQRFKHMRALATLNTVAPTFTRADIAPRFYDRLNHARTSSIFYEQGVYMADFTDDYDNSVVFVQYFPNYQAMNYEQLRTYFTWRTKIRNSEVCDASTSYAFMYIYELLNNIGVANPQEGLDKLLFFWNEYRVYNSTIDKYMYYWLKDYFIYYPLSESFNSFVARHGLQEHYPDLTEFEDSFQLFCPVSRYDIRNSAFYSNGEGNDELVHKCFNFVIERVREVFQQNNMVFDEAIFTPVRTMPSWRPFKAAVFHPWFSQPDRQVVISDREIYICSDNKWTFSTSITDERGRSLLGYIFKQIEAELRSLTKYRHKLTADISKVTHEAVLKLNNAGISLEAVIKKAVSDYYKETTKIVVHVDEEALARIREEALLTQEKLIVDDEFEPVILPVTPQDIPHDAPPKHEPPTEQDRSPWSILRECLDEAELCALSTLLVRNSTFKQYADSCGIMAEVLADSINVKACDCIGDNILDDDFNIYEDYEEDIKGMVIAL